MGAENVTTSGEQFQIVSQILKEVVAQNVQKMCLPKKNMKNKLENYMGVKLWY